MNKELKREIENTNDRMKKLKHIEKVLDDHNHICVIYDMYYELNGLCKIGQRRKGIDSINIWGDEYGIQLKASVPYKVDFDVIADLFTDIEVNGDGEILAVYHYDIKRKFNGITFKINDYSKAVLPDDYVEVLEMLGKIKTKKVSETERVYVSCEI